MAAQTTPAHRPPALPNRLRTPILKGNFMVEGFDNDDRWRMVEDEFCSVAARFTAHLHAAQYRRLKDEAKRQSTNTIQTLARPVTRPPTVDVVRRQAASTLAASQHRAIATAKSRIKAAASAPAAVAAAAAHSDDEDNDPFQIQLARKRTHLASLLNSPRKKAQPLTRTASAGKARAAASSTCGQTSSLGTRAGTPLALTVSLAKHHQMPTPVKLAHPDDELRGIPRRAASRGRLTSEQARSQADYDSEGNDLGQYSARPSKTRSSTTNTLLRPDPSTSASKMLVTGDASSQVSGPKEPTAIKDTSRTPARRSAEGNDDSDSGPETYFQRRMRERRGKHKLTRPRPTASNDPSGEGSRPKSPNTGSAALSVPSI
ncbi:hypothetical protein Daus18300_011129 [Diaporthe australafricana]|uniref:Uncharacterized protein n=1 Tax=Diaporthe australafricana TaxID=127596 RepID=A0ABR3W7U7_9PEZI